MSTIGSFQRLKNVSNQNLSISFVPKPMPFWRLLALAPLFADALDCSDRSDPVVATCCDAQSAWFSMEAAGGCGGEGATDNHCAHAAELCQRCRAAVDGTERKMEIPCWNQKLSSLDIGFLEMTCVLPQWSPCGVDTYRRHHAAAVGGWCPAVSVDAGPGDLRSFGWCLCSPSASAWRRRRSARQWTKGRRVWGSLLPSPGWQSPNISSPGGDDMSMSRDSLVWGFHEWNLPWWSVTR